jgi:hypothetical protein
MLVNLVGGPLDGQTANVTPWSDEYAAPLIPDGFMAWYLGIPTREIKRRKRFYAVYHMEVVPMRGKRMVFEKLEAR